MLKTTYTMLQTLRDLHQICSEESIPYCVIGSTGMVGAVGKMYRIPKDVDVLVDSQKIHFLKEKLIEKGYQKISQTNDFDEILPTPLERYKKGRQVIEPRAGKFIDGKFEMQLVLPLKFLPKQWRPKAKLVFGPELFRAKQYIFESVPFTSLRKEAFFFLLQMSQIPLKSVEGDSTKRQKDRIALSKNIDATILEKIRNDGSGIYWGVLPLITFKQTSLLGVLTRLAKTKK